MANQYRHIMVYEKSNTRTKHNYGISSFHSTPQCIKHYEPPKYTMHLFAAKRKIIKILNRCYTCDGCTGPWFDTRGRTSDQLSAHAWKLQTELWGRAYVMRKRILYSFISPLSEGWVWRNLRLTQPHAMNAHYLCVKPTRYPCEKPTCYPCETHVLSVWVAVAPKYPMRPFQLIVYI